MEALPYLVLCLLVIIHIVHGYTPLDIKNWTSKRVLVITAHPDDAEGYAGGLIAALRDSEIEVRYLILTSGNAGGMCYDDTGRYVCAEETDKETLALIRRQESIDAGAYLGVKTVYRLGMDDGLSIAYDETRVRRAISAYVRSYQPHIVLTHFPYPDFDIPPTCAGTCGDGETAGWGDMGFHPDHQHTGLMVYNALYGGGGSGDNNKLFHDLKDAGVNGWRIEELYFFALSQNKISHYFELDENRLKQKVQALGLHKSQWAEPPEQWTRWLRLSKQVDDGGRHHLELY